MYFISSKLLVRELPYKYYVRGIPSYICVLCVFQGTLGPPGEPGQIGQAGQPGLPGTPGTKVTEDGENEVTVPVCHHFFMHIKVNVCIIFIFEFY